MKDQSRHGEEGRRIIEANGKNHREADRTGRAEDESAEKSVARRK